MLWKTDFFTTFNFHKADRSVGFGGIWSQVALLHHQQNCLPSWLYMNTLFTSANSPKVMGLHEAKVWRKWCLPGVFSICKEAKKERSRIYWESECNFSENFHGNLIVFCHHYCAMRNGIRVLKVLSPDHWAACWRTGIKNAVCFAYRHWRTLILKVCLRKRGKKSKFNKWKLTLVGSSFAPKMVYSELENQSTCKFIFISPLEICTLKRIDKQGYQ